MLVEGMLADQTLSDAIHFFPQFLKLSCLQMLIVIIFPQLKPSPCSGIKATHIIETNVLKVAKILLAEIS